MIVGLGIDVVAVARIQSSIVKFGDRFVGRVFTQQERVYCQGKINPYPYYAVRFAAKEALFKAIGFGVRNGIAWRDAEVVHDGMGKPELVVSGSCSQILKEMNVERIYLSLSHTEDTGVAVVVLEKSEPIPTAPELPESYH
ncbi:MAG: holo-ACP synthase [bacterium]|nr:holo-ACP synthase [bacterium]